MQSDQNIYLNANIFCGQILDTNELSIERVCDQATRHELKFQHFVQANAKPFGSKLEINLPPGGKRK